MANQALVEKLAALLKDHTEVRAAYLFGSRARGSHRSTSDVDIAVAFAPATSAWSEVELQEQLTELSHPISLAAALDYAAMLHYSCREGQATQERAEAGMALASEKGFPPTAGSPRALTPLTSRRPRHYWKGYYDPMLPMAPYDSFLSVLPR
jgi:predicted nucleotidyltransferase